MALCSRFSPDASRIIAAAMIDGAIYATARGFGASCACAAMAGCGR